MARSFAAGDEEAFAQEWLRLAADETARAAWIEAGLRNVARFGTDTMIDHYLKLHDEIRDGDVIQPIAEPVAAEHA